MINEMKSFLKRFLPVTASTFHYMTQTMMDKNNQNISKIMTILVELSTKSITLEEAILKISSRITEVKASINEIDNKVSSMMASSVKNERIINELTKTSNTIHNVALETLWANRFNNTVIESDWLKLKTFSPSGWGAGYSFLYILYRVMRDIKPKKILEIGLGETTRIISQYCKEHQNVEHYVVEDDSEWVAFFSQGYDVPNNTKIVQLPLMYQPYKESESVRVYKGFKDHFVNGKYDLICIDGPSSQGMELYTRIDSLSILPGSLADSFIILVDDYNRIAEQNMVKDILFKLEEAVIPYRSHVYKGIKQTIIICSENLKFLVSL